MSEDYRQKIRDEALSVRRLITKLYVEKEWLLGRWEHVELRAVTAEQMHSDLIIHEIFEGDGIPPETRQHISRFRNLTHEVRTDLGDQDRLCGVDWRQVRGDGIRSWSFRGWEQPLSAELKFSMRYAVLKSDGDWTYDTEFRRRRTAIEQHMDYAGWFLQYFKEPGANAEDSHHVAWCRMETLVHAMSAQAVIATPLETPTRKWLQVPLADLRSHTDYGEMRLR